MRLAEIEATLPNGFHDANLIAIHRDLLKQVATLDIQVLIGLPDEAAEQRERVHQARLKFIEASILLIESPDVQSPFSSPGESGFVITEDEAGCLPSDLLAKLPAEHHTYTIFIQHWLSNIQIAAADLEFEWVNP
jgi:hypothetical protein